MKWPIGLRPIAGPVETVASFLTPKRRVPRVALLIDGDNISPKVMPRLLERVLLLGKPTVKRVFMNLSGGGARWSGAVAARSLVPVHVQPVSDGKNATDIALTIYAMDLLHSDRVDDFAIVSSDADFARLATRITEHGCVVHGFGVKQTPESFQRACSDFTFLETLVLKGVGGPLKSARWMLEPSDAEPLLVLAVLRMGGGKRFVSLSELGNHLARYEPEFDPRVFRRRSLRELLVSLESMDVQPLSPGYGVRLKIEG